MTTETRLAEIRAQFDRWLAAHDREIESRLVNNLEVMGGYLVVRGAHESEYPAGPEYGPYPGSDAEPIAPIDQIAGMKDYLDAHDRARTDAPVMDAALTAALEANTTTREDQTND